MSKYNKIRLNIDPGACGFKCYIEVERIEKYKAKVKIHGSRCEHIKRLNEEIKIVEITDILSPIVNNKVYKMASKTGCHPSCIIPVAIIKGVEIILDLSVPKDVNIQINRGFL